MPQERLKMRKLKELLRLKLSCQLSNRQVARAINVSSSTVSHYAQAANASHLTWDGIKDLDDQQIKQRLYPYCDQLVAQANPKQPLDFKTIHQELKRKGVTRQLLWTEYYQKNDSQAYSYPEFCRQYKKWKNQLNPVMRQEHKAGKAAMVDYAGPKVDIHDPQTGEVKQAIIFVGVLPASNFTFAEATWTRSLPDWIGSHVRMYQFFGGVPELTIPDNEKAGVKNACYYDPEINPHYAALAVHYDTVILPTRPRKPRDKAKVELAVQIVERDILAKLRHRKFFSLAELNQAIKVLLAELNNKPFQKLPGCRQSQFEKLDKPALKPLPTTPYELTDIKRAQVGLDYHVSIDNNNYSVPYQLISKVVEYHLTQNTVAVFYQGKRVASHTRCFKKGQTVTCAGHMPKAHRLHQQWSPQQFGQWAQGIGSAMEMTSQYIINHQPHPECCYRIHLGLRNLAKRYGTKRLEQACRYALQQAIPSYRSIKSILVNCLENQLTTDDNINNDTNHQLAQSHKYIRGANYYQIYYQHEEGLTCN